MYAQRVRSSHVGGLFTLSRSYFVLCWSLFSLFLLREYFFLSCGLLSSFIGCLGGLGESKKKNLGLSDIGHVGLIHVCKVFLVRVSVCSDDEESEGTTLYQARMDNNDDLYMDVNRYVDNDKCIDNGSLPLPLSFPPLWRLAFLE